LPASDLASKADWLALQYLQTGANYNGISVVSVPLEPGHQILELFMYFSKLDESNKAIMLVHPPQTTFFPTEATATKQ
jgi:hypothetical protein